jgi:hypothetical protein
VQQNYSPPYFKPPYFKPPYFSPPYFIQVWRLKEGRQNVWLLKVAPVKPCEAAMGSSVSVTLRSSIVQQRE